jgi:hypothetical protein
MLRCRRRRLRRRQSDARDAWKRQGTSAPIFVTFYVKRRSDYKPHITPSYVLTRENGAVREREALAAKVKAEHEQAREHEHEVDNELWSDFNE